MRVAPYVRSPLFLVLITLTAAIVNGALGYGFSSITVPLTLLFLTNRVLNPALVLIEVPLNASVPWVNRAALASVCRRVLPIVFGLAPGVIACTLIVSQVSPAWLKLSTFVALLPLVLVQAAGFRRPVRAERLMGLAFGSGVGALYAVTTVSGPPLALMLNNQGLAKQEFRAALGLIRLAESTFTAIAYFYAGLYALESLALIAGVARVLPQRVEPPRHPDLTNSLLHPRDVAEFPDRRRARLGLRNTAGDLLLRLGVDVIADLAIEVVEVGAPAHVGVSERLRILAIAPASLSHLVVSTESCFRPCGVKR